LVSPDRLRVGWLPSLQKPTGGIYFVSLSIHIHVHIAAVDGVFPFLDDAFSKSAAFARK